MSFSQGDPTRAENAPASGLLQGSELQSFVALLARRKLLIVTVTMLAVLTGAGLALTSAKVYEASALLRVSAATTSGSVRDVQDASVSQAQTDAATINNRSFLTQAAQKLRLSSDLVLARVSADIIPNTALIQVHATGPTTSDAERLAQQVSEYAVTAIGQATTSQTKANLQALNRQLNTRSAKIADLTKGLTTLPVGDVRRDTLNAQINAEQAALQPLVAQIASLQGQLVPTLGVQSKATASSLPVSPRPLFDTAIALFFGLVFGVILAWLREQLDRTVRSLSEVEHMAHRPILAVVPILRAASSSAPEQLHNVFDVLRVQLAIANATLEGKVFTITSAREGEGKTFTVHGTARALARAGRRVLVIDADLRRKGLSRLLEAEMHRGVSEVVLGQAHLADVIYELQRNLFLLPAGAQHPSPPALFDSQAFESLLATVRNDYDVVLIDTPPIRQVADGVLVGSRSDGVLLVIRLGTVTRPDLKTVLDTLRAPAFKLLGEVVHSADADVESYAYGPDDSRRLFRRRPKDGDGYYPDDGELAAAAPAPSPAARRQRSSRSRDRGSSSTS